MTQPFKRCSCGRTFTRYEWYGLKMLGVQRTDDGRGQTFAMELRNCGCGSTLSLEHRTDNAQLIVNGSKVSLESFIDANEDSPELLNAVLQVESGETGTFGRGTGTFFIFTKLPPELEGPKSDYVEPEERER